MTRTTASIRLSSSSMTSPVREAPSSGPSRANVNTRGVDRSDLTAGVNLGLATVERKEMQFLYREGNEFGSHGHRTYERYQVPAAVVADTAGYFDRGVDLSRPEASVSHRGSSCLVPSSSGLPTRTRGQGVTP